MKLNLNNINYSQNLNLSLLFIALFSSFFLWDLKNFYFDLRFLIIICSLVILIINFRSLNFVKYYIVSIILFILIHYFINLILRDLSFEINIIIFSFYLLISYYYLDYNKEQLTKIFPTLSKSFLILSFLIIIFNFQNLNYIEVTQSGACAFFTNFSDLKFKHFIENSHFGMVAPAAIFCFLFSIKQNEFLKPKNVLLYIVICSLCISIFSMTLLLGLLVGYLSLIFSINKKNYLYFIIPTILIILSILSINFKESCSSRLERMSIIKNVEFLELKEDFETETLSQIVMFKNFVNVNKNDEKINKCLKLNSILDEVRKKEMELNSINKKITTNFEQIKKMKNASDKMFSLQMETKILKDRREDILKKISNLLAINISSDKIKSLCSIDISDEFSSYFNLIENYQNLAKDFSYKANVIFEADKKYKNPNITTQVYQIALLNTYKSIKENPLGWGYGNYSYSHFNYVLDNIIKLNLDTFVDTKPDETKDMYNVKDNMQDPDVFYLNYNDGRNNFSKLLTEFGYLALILFIFLIIFGLSQKISLIDKSFLLPLIATQLGSGAGYTNGGFALAIIITFIIYKNQSSKIS